MKDLFGLVRGFFGVIFVILSEMVFSLLMDSDSYSILQEIKFHEEQLALTEREYKLNIER